MAATFDGFAQGTLLFAILLATEVLALDGGFRSALGNPFPTVLSLYLLAGAALGIVSGLGAGLVARVVPGRSAVFSFMLLAYVCTALFLLRKTPSHELATSPRLIAIVVAGVVAAMGTTWWARRRHGPESPRTRSVRFTGCAVAALACLLAAAWVPVRHHRLPTRHVADTNAPNVVFVLVDALRADRLSCMGYERPTTPFIDRLAARGATFANAYSHGNRTIIAMPSLFTSIYPSYTRTIASGNWSTPLPDSQTTLAEMFRESGYSTMAMMSNPYLKRAFGLTQGFDRAEEFNSGRFHLSLYRLMLSTGRIQKPNYANGVSASAKEVTDVAVDWIARVPPQSPYFCYVHYMDVHHPYLPPRVFEDMFNTHDRLSAMEPATLFAKTVELVRKQQPYPLDDNELTRLSDLYDACIRYVDSEIARLVNAAQNANDRPTIVVITSDHGDEFQEHGFLYHNNVVIEELIRVPLVVWRSDRPLPARRIEQLVRHVDVLPTLAEWIGMSVPSRAIGRSLVPLMNGEGEDKPRATVAEGDYCSALVEPGWKMMWVDTAGVGVLFDLAKDPRANCDVASLYPDRFENMTQFLDGYFRHVPDTSPGVRTEVDAATLRQLKALGYIN